ncbi:MAG TPA: hypothetical protein VK540_26560 [Polyangiaceae bacterium]|nr:hypothetical protein [Polyangiaceae bacterium]
MTARTLQIARRRIFKGSRLKAIYHKPLELVADEEGSITLGWVDAGVFYARFIGVLSAGLAERHTARLEAALERAPSLHYFADARALSSYDLGARSAFRRTVLAHRSQFKSLVLLTWSQGITPVARAFASALGEPVDVLADDLAFEGRLLDAAPLARGKLDPNGWLLPPLLPRSAR